MGLYEGIKDVMSIAQKADNIDLYRQLLDLSAQALDLQAEVARLREENSELKKKHELADQIIRHDNPYVTLSGDSLELCYCSHCWDSNQLLIQLNCDNNGMFVCPHCKAEGIYDKQKKKAYDEHIEKAMTSSYNINF